MTILDSNGKVIPKVTPPKEGHDLVECNFLVSDMKKVEENSAMVLMTPHGPMPVPLEQVLSQIAKNLYGVLTHLKQKQVIFSIEDKSSGFIKEKQLAINVLQMKSDGNEEQEAATEEGTAGESAD